MTAPAIPAVPEGMKRCTKCGEVKPVSEFSRNKSNKDGLEWWCKSCRAKNKRKYYEQNRSKVAEYKRKYYEQNADKVSDACHKYRERNLEKDAERKRKYYACIKRPSCPRAGGRGATFITFTCEVCGTEFRKLKSYVDSQYENRGSVPRFCSRDCQYAAMRKNYKSPYARKIEDIKTRLKN